MKNGFNPGQEEAIHGINGEWIVISCPGSGKTTVIIERAHFMVTQGINPRKILIVTFTKEAALEMERRYIEQFGKDGIAFGTIHSICYRVLTEANGYGRENILTELDKWKYFREKLLRKEDQNRLDETIRSVMSDISMIKNSQLDVRSYKPERVKKDLFVELYEAYEQDKHRSNKIDFDDMLILCRDILKERPDILQRWQQMFEYIMIDEFQDTNGVQYEIFCMLTKQTKNLFVVGDDDQSIYKFRAADAGIMLDFAKHHPGSHVVNMSVNYRSEPEIIEAASRLIGNNRIRFRKQFEGAKNGQGVVKYEQYRNLSEQADEIVKRIETYHEQGIAYGDMAVLFRNNAQNRVPASRTLKTEVPFYTTEPVRDIHTEFIFGDIQSYYRLAEGSGIRGDFMRVLNHPSRYLKQEYFRDFIAFEESALYEKVESMTDARTRHNAMDRMEQMSASMTALRGASPEDFMEYFTSNQFGYRNWLYEYAEWRERDPQEFLDILNILKEEASNFRTMGEWFRYVDEYAELLQDKNREKEREGVCFSTFHSAKGLEWEVVFIIDANEEITPFKKAVKTGDIEEERRLFYVAVTRAKSHLHVSWTGIGRNCPTISRFVYEMQGVQKSGTMSAHGVGGRVGSRTGNSAGGRTGSDGRYMLEKPEVSKENGKQKKAFSKIKFHK